jgi:nucleoside-diphosphate-sugar epimerase
MHAYLSPPRQGFMETHQFTPQNEENYGNVNTIGPRGVYDEAKRFQESTTMSYHRFHGLETRIARIVPKVAL